MVNGCEAGAAGGREGTCWHAGKLRSRDNLMGLGRAAIAIAAVLDRRREVDGS